MKRTLETLILTDEDYIFEGDLTITGEVCLINSNLIVAGKLSFTSLDGESFPVEIIGGDISVYDLESEVDIYIRDGDIWAVTISYVQDIDSDGNIEAFSVESAYDIKCLNYLVSGDSNTCDITAVQDIYILGSNNSLDLIGRDIFICEGCCLNDCSIFAKTLECLCGIEECSSISIG